MGRLVSGTSSCPILNPREVQRNTLYPACQLVSISLVLVTRLLFSTRRDNGTDKTSGIHSYWKQFLLDHIVHFPFKTAELCLPPRWFFQLNLATLRCGSNNFTGVHGARGTWQVLLIAFHPQQLLCYFPAVLVCYWRSCVVFFTLL